MISTDKAVNPSSVMGATKRLAEMYVQSLGSAIQEGNIIGKTSFITTRFQQCAGQQRQCNPPFPPTDNGRGPCDSHASGHHSLFHDYPRSFAG